ncbi:FHA domain-containing protein [Streptomyces arenae]|uniref:FHA domain-containing protein n=1 Tax=Streptomyces arenae TaxID=29301 RepID=UPI002659E010|nr:FHA domain-containing protein [Streptomyces arenae]MCG7207124.1 FHA domain-containing protein [Streptomyces arenae]
MQIRLTVVDPLGPAAQRGRAVSRDVLVTAPAGTDLAAVASGLAAAVTGDGSLGGREQSSAPVVLYAGVERLDARRRILGEPPLVDGAVLSLGAPAAPEPHPELDDAPTQLHVIAGPDAGGVHLLHGGQITIGRSADADIPLDDPDVSRLHCAVTVGADGRVSVADLHSTNGTALDGTRVTDRPVRLTPGALLRVGESALRLTPSGGPGARVGTAPDGEGCVRVLLGDEGPLAGEGEESDGSGATGGTGGLAGTARGTAVADGPAAPAGRTQHAYGTAGWGAPGPAAAGREHGPAQSPVVPAQGEAPRIERRGGPTPSGAGAAGRAGGALGGRAGESSSAGSGSVDGRFPAGAGHHESSPMGHRGGPSGPHGAATDSSGPGPDSHPGYDSGHGHGSGHRHDSGSGTRSGSGSGDTHAGRAGLYGGPGARDTGADRTPPGTTAPASATPGTTRPPASDPAAAARAAAGPAPTPSAPHRTAPDASAPADHTSAGTPSEGAAPAGRRKGTPLRGTDAPVLPGARRRGGLGAWARRLAGGRGEPLSAADGETVTEAGLAPSADVATQPETWPDPAALLLTALGPGPRLWERGPGHPEALTVRLGTADRPSPDGSGLLPAVPVTAGLREAGALGLAGPRSRLAGLARAVLAQLTALHSPDLLEIVLISADRARPLEDRTAEWSWLGWLPHVRPGHGQDCRLLLAYDREQAAARVEELLRRVEDLSAPRRPATPADRPALTGTADAPSAAAAHRPSWARGDLGDPGADGADGRGGFPGPYTVVVVDGDPGGAALRDAVARLTVAGPRAGVHVLCLAETAPTSPASPVAETYEQACAVTPTFRECGAVALLSGDVATALHLVRVSAGPVGPGTLAAVDAVSAAWAERFARALAPLRSDGPAGDRHARVAAPLPQSARLLDELGLARATPASLMARWADAADDTESLGGRARAVLGAGPHGPLVADLVTEGPHLLIEGPPGSGRTELLRALVASLAAAERPDRLGIVLIDGRDGVGTGAGQGEGLRVCTDIPHVTTHLTANDPVRMRELAQSLSAELKRRAELLGRGDFTEWHAQREISGRIVPQRGRPAASGAADIEAPPSSTLRLRPSAGAAARRRTETPPPPPLPRLVVVVDDLDALVSPALGSPGRPAAGSVMRALEAVAKEGERLGVHLVAAAGTGGRTAETEPARQATLRVALDAPATGPDEPAPGRGRLTTPDGRATAFQAGRVTGRIPRTATQRPTVVALDWHRMGDPPARRPVRELGNGPTDLALLASAVERAAKEVSAAEVPSLL